MTMKSTTERQDSPQNPKDVSYYRSPANPSVAKPIPKWLFPSIFLGGLLAFMLIVGRAEISRWHEANALNAATDRRFEDAVRAATKGLSWDPTSTSLLHVRSLARLELKDYEGAIADRDLIIEIASKVDPYSSNVVRAKGAKASILQRMSRYKESIALWTEVVDHHEHQYELRNDTISLMEYTQALNNRAYTEAQAHVVGVENIDIQLALRDSEKAIELRARDEPFMVDTRGYLKLLNGEPEQALMLLDDAVTVSEQVAMIRRAELKRKMNQATDQRPQQDAIRDIDEQLAVILHHRGEAYQALGEAEKGQADIDRAIELGYDREAGIW